VKTLSEPRLSLFSRSSYLITYAWSQEASCAAQSFSSRRYCSSVEPHPPAGRRPRNQRRCRFLNVTATSEQKFSPDHLVLHVASGRRCASLPAAACTASPRRISEFRPRRSPRASPFRSWSCRRKPARTRSTARSCAGPGTPDMLLNNRRQAMIVPRRVLLAVGFAAAVTVAAAAPALAMPNFAQAYGVPCSTCHTRFRRSMPTGVTSSVPVCVYGRPPCSRKRSRCGSGIRPNMTRKLLRPTRIASSGGTSKSISTA